MKGKLKYFAIGILGFALFLLARIPASVAFDRFSPYSIQASGVVGTIWHGNAANLAVSGLQLGPTSWRFQLSNLFSAELAYAFETQIGGESLTGTAAVRGPGKLRLTDVVGQIPIKELSAFLPTGFLTGIARIDASELRIENNWPASVDGRFVISDLTALTTRPPTLLGDFEAIFEDQRDAPLKATLKDLSGPVELDGQLLLNADRSFELEATLAPKPDAAPQISNMLNFVGPEDGQGRRQLRYSGSF